MVNYLSNIKENILSSHGMRFIPSQKKSFLAYLREEMAKLGFESKLIKKNLVVGDIDKAEYIFTAHYDTPGKIPFYLSYLYRLFGNTSIILFPLSFFILFGIYSKIILMAISSPTIANMLINLPLILLVIGIFIPNKNNYNDNTSGVLTLINIANKVSIENIDKEKVAFVFFNNEEWGLLGSASIKKYWKKNKISLQNKKIINFDCVGNGDTILITHGKIDKLAKEVQNKFRLSTTFDVAKFKYKGMPLSDDFNFRKQGGIGIIFCEKSKLFKGYYIPNVHSSRDTILNLENIELCTDTLLNYIEDKNSKAV